MKILVAGINGFVGKNLTREAVKLGYEVHGVSTQDAVDSSIAEACQSYTKADLTDLEQVRGLDLETYNAIINLAGLAAVGPSFDKPELYMNVNVAVHTQMLEQMVACGSKARYIAVSTGAVYDSGQQMPIGENGTLLESSGSPYAKSKIAMEKAVLEYADKLDVVVVRPFNHIGPGQEDGFVVPDTYRKIVEARGSGKDFFMVGPTNKARDNTDVRDVARAYLMLASAEELPENRIFNVCSGRSVQVARIIEILQRIAGTDLEPRLDDDLVRPHDPDDIVGDCSKLKNTTGWQTTYELEQTLEDFVKSKRGV